MNLPNFFIADLPADFAVRPDMVLEACLTLKRNRERYLLPRSTESLIQAVSELARAWLSPHSPWRAMALDQGPKELGLSREMLAWGLDSFFRQVTPRNLTALLVQDLGHPEHLPKPHAFGEGIGAAEDQSEATIEEQRLPFEIHGQDRIRDGAHQGREFLALDAQAFGLGDEILPDLIDRVFELRPFSVGFVLEEIRHLDGLISLKDLTRLHKEPSDRKHQDPAGPNGKKPQHERDDHEEEHDRSI